MNESNAQLIAAAPAMLEALEVLVALAHDRVTCITEMGYGEMGHAEPTRAGIRLAHAALAAARGESPSPTPNN